MPVRSASPVCSASVLVAAAAAMWRRRLSSLRSLLFRGITQREVHNRQCGIGFCDGGAAVAASNTCQLSIPFVSLCSTVNSTNVKPQSPKAPTKLLASVQSWLRQRKRCPTVKSHPDQLPPATAASRFLTTTKTRSAATAHTARHCRSPHRHASRHHVGV